MEAIQTQIKYSLRGVFKVDPDPVGVLGSPLIWRVFLCANLTSSARGYSPFGPYSYTCPMNSARRQSSQRNLRKSDLRRSEMGLINFSGVGFKYSLKASANTQCLMLLRSYIHKPSFIKKCSLVPFANFHIRRRRFNFDGQP